MRISDDRYNRERLSLDLALRFLRHEARTQTIRTWTGLTDDRIRNLYRSYMSRGAHFVPRHRGKSPHQVVIVTKEVQIRGCEGKRAISSEPGDLEEFALSLGFTVYRFDGSPIRNLKRRTMLAGNKLNG